jgi:hypothetical protein
MVVHHWHTFVANAAVMGSINFLTITLFALYLCFSCNLDFTWSNKYDCEIIKNAHKAQKIPQINENWAKSWKIFTPGDLKTRTQNVVS